MAAALNFLTSNGSSFINFLAGSGLGFYGPAGFGSSVPVGSYQSNTFITDSTGALEGPLCQNVQWIATNSGNVNAGNFYPLTSIPNVDSTLNIRFTYDSAVQIVSPSLNIYDRTNINNPASGLICQVAEIVHPSATPGTGGSGSTAWVSAGGSGGVINGYTYGTLTFNSPSPGSGGLAPNGQNTVDSQHDYYFAISPSCSSIGSKSQFGLYFSLEYV
jgi:hypothetical protein